MTDIRDAAAIQAEFDQVCALLGDADVKIAQLQAQKDALLVRARELGQEMHLARKIQAAQVASAAKAPAAAPEPPRDPLVAPGSSAREVVAARKDDLKRAAERLAGALPVEADDPKPEAVQ